MAEGETPCKEQTDKFSETPTHELSPRKDSDSSSGSTSRYPDVFDPLGESTPIRSESLYERYHLQTTQEDPSATFYTTSSFGSGRRGSDSDLLSLDQLPVEDIFNNVKSYLDRIDKSLAKANKKFKQVRKLDDDTLSLVNQVINSAKERKTKRGIKRKRRHSSSSLHLQNLHSTTEGKTDAGLVVPVSVTPSEHSVSRSVAPDFKVQESDILDVADEVLRLSYLSDSTTSTLSIVSDTTISDTDSDYPESLESHKIITKSLKTLGSIRLASKMAEHLKTTGDVNLLIKSWEIHLHACNTLAKQWSKAYNHLWKINKADLEEHLKKMTDYADLATNLSKSVKDKYTALQSENDRETDPEKQELTQALIDSMNELCTLLDRIDVEVAEAKLCRLDEAIRAGMKKAIDEGADVTGAKVSLKDFLAQPSPPGPIPGPGGPPPVPPNYPPKYPPRNGFDQTKLIRDLPYYEPSLDADCHLTRFKDFWKIVLTVQPNLTKTDQCFWFKMSLRAAARQWYEHNLEKREDRLDPDEMFKLFIDRFSTHGATEETRRQNWYKLNWRLPGESIDDFVYRAASLAKSLNIGNSELVQRIKSCVPKSIYPHIMGIHNTGDIINQIKQLQSMGFALVDPPAQPSMQTVATMSTGPPAVNMPFMSLSDYAPGGKQVRFSNSDATSSMADMVSQLSEIREELKQLASIKTSPRPLKSPTPGIQRRDGEGNRDRESRSQNRRDNNNYRNSGYNSGYGSRDNSRDHSRDNSRDRSRDRSRSRDRFRRDDDRSRGYNDSRSPSRKFFEAYKTGATDILQAFQQPQRQNMQSPIPFGNNYNNYGRGQGPQFDCHACGKRGHSFRNCTDLKRLIQMAVTILNQQRNGQRNSNQAPQRGDNFNCVADAEEVIALALQLGELSTN